jgi:phosphate-selective porin
MRRLLTAFRAAASASACAAAGATAAAAQSKAKVKTEPPPPKTVAELVMSLTLRGRHVFLNGHIDDDSAKVSTAAAP